MWSKIMCTLDHGATNSRNDVGHLKKIVFKRNSVQDEGQETVNKNK